MDTALYVLCPFPPQPGLDAPASGEACKGCWVIPFSGSGWGLGWAPGWRTSQALPGAQTSQAPPAQPQLRCRSPEPGTNYRGPRARPCCSGGWRWGPPLDIGPGEGTLWSPQTSSWSRAAQFRPGLVSGRPGLQHGPGPPACPWSCSRGRGRGLRGAGTEPVGRGRLESSGHTRVSPSDGFGLGGCWGPGPRAAGLTPPRPTPAPAGWPFLLLPGVLGSQGLWASPGKGQWGGGVRGSGSPVGSEWGSLSRGPAAEQSRRCGTGCQRARGSSADPGSEPSERAEGELLSPP